MVRPKNSWPSQETACNLKVALTCFRRTGIAFQTAVALAEYDAEKDEEGKILLTDSHLRAVVELSRDFKDYLNDLHKGDEGKRAERKYDRLDSFSKGETLK